MLHTSRLPLALRVVLVTAALGYTFPLPAFAQTLASGQVDVGRQPLEDDVRVPDDALTRIMVEAVASGDVRIDALASGYKWPATALTYSFYSDAVFGGQYYGRETGVREVSAAVKANVRRLLAFYGTFMNVTFTEVVETAVTVGQIRVMTSTQESYAYAYYPSSTPGANVGGDVHLNPAFDRLGDTNGFQHGPGAHGYLALAHELGHALGLKHPHSNTPNLPASDDNSSNTVMSYNFLGASPGTPMAYDMLALQYVYGARAQRTGNDVYTFTRTAVDQYASGGQVSLDPSSGTKQTIWDAGGYNTLDFSAIAASPGGYRLDLRPFGWLTTSEAFKTTSYETGTTIGPGVRIMAVLGSPGSDTIYANAEANVFGGYTPGRPTGADVIIGADGADRLDLSAFAPGQVTQTATGSDLVLRLGSSGSITLVNYYGGNRPTITFGSSAAEVSIDSVRLNEGNAGVSLATFAVTLSPPQATSVAVSYTTSAGTATPGVDFASVAGTLVFAPGQGQQLVLVPVFGDTTPEPDETFAVLLSAPTAGVVIASAQGDGTILNDDEIAPPPAGGNQAAFVALDVTTQGSWVGRYGTQGHVIPLAGSGGIGASSVRTGDASTWTWAAGTADVRALQTGAGAGRSATTWFGSAFTIDIALPDDQPRRVAVYCVDWDRVLRAQTLEMTDADTGAVLDRRTLAGFSTGTHVVWLVRGRVRLRVIADNPVNAVVSGVFIDAPASAPVAGTATYAGLDTTTRGNWQTAYGRDGYVIAADRTLLPASGAMTVSAGVGYTWTSTTTDDRALTRADGGDRVAATWFSDSVVSVDVSVDDGRTRQVALYCLDWDERGRTQTIEVVDAATGSLLDRRTVSSFASGQYLLWQVRGAVRFRVVNAGGVNAVVSGVFLDTP